MVSIRLPAIAAGTAVLLALASVAYGAPDPAQGACARALAAADRAEHGYEALKGQLQQIIAEGGHPDASQRQVLAAAEARRDSTASQAQRVCGP
ncbi:hypothetical protein [Streptomyces sp. NPDC007905]|uniref:hypothetical protein n=1 Tax=Streptomyces sp. NPDC007905 TaxID=3364788 RepID=UPI0036E5C542